MLKWIIGDLSEENSTASVNIEFSDQCELDDVFPVFVVLDSDQTFFQFNVNKVVLNNE